MLKASDYLKTTEGQLQAEKKIEEVLENIDFERIHKIMVADNWTWFNPKKGTRTTPTAYEIYLHAKDLMTKCVYDDLAMVGCGGIEIRVEVYDDNDADMDEELTNELRQRPNDFWNRVDIRFAFVVEQNCPMY